MCCWADQGNSSACRLQRVLSEVRNPTKWQLQDYATDMEWVHPTANIALMGDAVHAMVRQQSKGSGHCTEKENSCLTCHKAQHRQSRMLLY